MTDKRPRRWIAAAALTAIGFSSSIHAATSASTGEAIYRRGVLPAGQELVATRESGPAMSGKVAACINCHRRSGLGTIEGRSTVPPITGRYLFHPRAANKDDLDLPFVEGMRADRDPYTEATLARAIRDGIAADGRPLSYLMPRYALDDAAMSELIDYLKHLSVTAVPGVTSSVLHFATIVTPDADPIERQAMLAVMQQYFIDKNAFTRAQSPRLHASRRIGFKANRTWQLHVWELQGSPDTWGAQLRRYLAAEPVFAVLSGLEGKTWAPIHAFCEEVSLPCLFPNASLPVEAESDFYSLYFSKGVLLDAQLIERNLADSMPATGQQRIVQVFRAQDVGAAAARELKAKLPADTRIADRELRAKHAAHDLRVALADLGPEDAAVLWLRASDLADLADVPIPRARIYLSGTMAGLNYTALPPAWRAVAHVAYPLDLPERRIVRMDYPLGWFRLRQIPVTAERVQADTYLALSIVSETLNHMADTFERDYLIERIEATLEHRVITGYYPRLALAPGQRFASKGGYVVHFSTPGGIALAADTDWFVP